MRGELTTAQLAAGPGRPLTMASDWERQAMEGPASGFAGKATAPGAHAKTTEAREGEAACADRAALGGAGYFGDRVRSMSLDRGRRMIEPEHPRLSLVCQRHRDRSAVQPPASRESRPNPERMRPIEVPFRATPR